MKSERAYVRFIAYMQVIGIILVVLGHSFHQYPDGVNGDSNIVHRMIYSFHMPMFLFVSGYLLEMTSRARGFAISTGRFIRSKARRLLLPYLTLTLLTFIPRSLMSGMADDAVPLSWGSLLVSVFDGRRLLIPFFWYLQVCFILLTGGYALLRVCSRRGIDDRLTYAVAAALFLIAALIPVEATSFMSVDRLLELGVYFVAGGAYCRFGAAVDRKVPWNSPAVAALTFIIWAFLFFITENSAFSPLCAFAGIAMCISVAKMLESRPRTLLDHLTGANYMIFLLSWYFNIAAQQVLAHFVVLPWWVYSLLSLLSGIYLPWLVFKYLDSHRNSSAARILRYILGH